MDERKNTSSEEDGILIEEQEVAGFKCGVCGVNLRVKVFFKDDEYHRKISCPKCGVTITPSERMPL